ncbi:MAG: methyltransferase domain-containing protein [Deltaproteobacteria bacterium]
MTTSSHSDQPADLTAIIQGAQRAPRARASLGLGEFLPRYLLVEAALEGRRVLEVGTDDPRSLLRLLDAGAQRVIGTAPDAGAFDRSRFGSHAVELFSMDRGRVDFPDDSFDAVLVADLSRELAANARFLDEVRRVLSTDGFMLVGFAATGRSLTHLAADEGEYPELEPHRLESAVKDTFPDARFYVQSPFIGVTIHREGQDPASLDVSLDPSLSGPVARPSHVLAIGGAGAPEPQDRTLVELPFLDFEALQEAVQAKSAADTKRLLGALASARKLIGQRDASLEEIKNRLPRIREAFHARLAEARAQSSLPAPQEIISPTVLERPTEDNARALVSRLESARQELGTRVDGLNAALEREKAARAKAEAELEAFRGAEVEREEVIQDLRTKVDVHAEEAQRYATRISELQRTIVDQSSEIPQPSEDLSEAERRIHHLERTASLQEQRIAELEQELSGQLEVRHALGTDYRDAASRIEYLTRRLDDVTMVHAAEQDRLEGRIAFLAEALSDSDQRRERAEQKLSEIENEEEHVAARRAAAEERAEQAERAYEQSAQVTRGLADEVNRLRHEAHQRAGRIEALERELLDQAAQMQAASGDARMRDRDKKAVELAAGHLMQEVEQLRTRVKALRNERDALAATSQMLLDERDAATGMAQRAIASEERAQQLALSLEGGQAALDRLEREVEDARDAAEAANNRHLHAVEENKKLKGELEALRSRMSQAESSGSAETSRAQALDDKLAALERRLDQTAAERDRALRAKDELEELLREATMAASEGVREARMWRERNEALERDAKDHLDQMGTALAEKVRAEGEAAEAVWSLTRSEAERTLYRTELASLRRQRVLEQTTPQADPEALREAVAARETAETALGRTLEEAAKLSMRLTDLEKALAESNARADQLEGEKGTLERQRQDASRSEKSIEAARVHAVMEAKSLADRVNRLEFEQTALLRELEARENDVLTLEGALREAQAKIPPETPPSMLPQPALADDDEVDILRSRVASDARTIERLKADRFEAHQRVEQLESALAVGPGPHVARAFEERQLRMEAEEAAQRLRSQLEAVRAEALSARYAETDDRERLAMQAELRRIDGLRRRAIEEAETLRAELRDAQGRSRLVAHQARLEASLRVEALEDALALTRIQLRDAHARAERMRVDAEDEIEALASALVVAQNGTDPRQAEAAEEERQRLTAHIARLEAAAGAHFDEVERLRAELSKREADAAQREAEHEDAKTALAEQIESLGRARADAIAERSTLEGLLQALAEEQQSVEEEHTALKSKAEALDANLTAANETRGQLEVELAAVRLERDELVASRGQLEDTLASAEAERDEAAEAQSRLDAELKAARSERDEAAEALATARAEAEEARRRIESQDERIAAVEAERDAAKHEGDERFTAERGRADEAEQTLEAARAEAEEAQERVASLEERIGQVEASRKAADELLTRRLEDRDAHIRELEVQRDTSSERIEQLEGEVRALEERLRELGTIETQLRPLEERVQVLSDERVAAQEERAALEARIHSLTDERTKIEAELSEAIEARDEARAERSIAAQERSRLDSEVAALRAEVQRLQAEERNLEETKTSVQAALATEQNNRERLEAELASKDEALMTATAEADEAKRIAEDADRELSAAVSRLDAASAERDRMQAELTRVSEALDEAKGAQQLLEHQQMELEGLRADVANAEAARTVMEARIEDLVSVQEVEASRFAETTGERDTLRALVEASKEEQDALHAKIQGLTDDLAAERKAGQERVARLAQTAGERDGLKSEITALRDQVAEQSARAKEGWDAAQAEQQAREETESRLAEANRALAGSNPALAEEQRMRAERAEAEASRVAKELDETKLTIAQLEERRSNAESKLSKAEADVERMRAESERSADRARHAEAFSKESEARAQRLEEKRKTLEQRSLEAEGRAEHAERQRRHLELEVQQKETRWQAKLEEVEGRVRTVEDQRQQVEAAKGKVEARLSQLEQELGSTSRSNLETALTAARERIVELEAGASSNSDALRGRVQNLERALADRDGEVKRLKALAERTARELDEARAEVGRKLSEIRQGREGLEFVRRQLTQARSDSDILRGKLEQRGDVDRLRTDVEARDQQLARLTAEATAMESESHRLRAQLQASEQAQVQAERRITELETTIDDRERQLERVSRELSEKTERLRRLAGLSDG